MAKFEIRDPRTAAVIATMSETPVATVDRMGQVARGALGSWRSLGIGDRITYLRRVHRTFYQRRHELVDRATRETGRPDVEVLTAGILANLDLISYFCRIAPAELAPELLPTNALNYPRKRAVVHHEPFGVIAVVASWNCPIAPPMRAIVPALLAGNCVLFKPSKEAALTGECLGEVFEENLPAGVFATAQGGRRVIQAVVRNAHRLSFTGSTATGRALAHQCGNQMIPASYELGGVDAAIVLPDCDLVRTVHGVVWGAFANSGQDCGSIRRLLLHRDLAQSFLPWLIEETKKLRLGEDLGPLRSAAQLATVEAHVKDALSRGAKLLCGGRATGTGYYYEPAVLQVSAHEDLSVEQETFGLALPVLIVDSEGEAIRLCNAVNCGSTASVWTKDLAKGERICAQLDVGVAMVNNARFSAALPQAPWGGVKGTGFGIANSRFVLRELTHPKLVLVDSSSSRELWWFPYNERLRNLLEAMIDASAGKVHRMTSALPNVLRRWS
ncbi:MAG: aldehyde dehydrogenase family protein [Polyangiaceae bacterium]|jgi:acyl-CoA reductase-like NAD-dependent aldehyde dehydrogenase|nr:aldehyde dehydrogenase family protein [Polyangiaceae bacterium]